MKNNDVFLNGEWSLLLKECKKGYLIIAHQEFKSGKHFDTTLGWCADKPTNVEIEVYKKGE